MTALPWCGKIDDLRIHSVTNCYSFLRFFRAAKRPATRPATPSANIMTLEGSGIGVPPEDEPPDDEPVDVVPLDVLLDVLVEPP